eukprot:scaffold9062_cov154-Amphora_coffeaeformis.AAC.2
MCCSGDRVVFSVDKLELEELRCEADADNEPAAVDIHGTRLQKAGVSVEIREVSNLEGSKARSTQEKQS